MPIYCYLGVLQFDSTLQLELLNKALNERRAIAY